MPLPTINTDLINKATGKNYKTTAVKGNQVSSDWIKGMTNSAGTAGTGAGTDGVNNITDQSQGDIEIENPYNDYTQYWAEGEIHDHENRLVGDIPDVRIYISYQKLPKERRGGIEVSTDVTGYRIDHPTPYLNSENTVVKKDKYGNKIYVHAAMPDKTTQKLTGSEGQIIKKDG